MRERRGSGGVGGDGWVHGGLDERRRGGTEGASGHGGAGRSGGGAHGVGEAMRHLFGARRGVLLRGIPLEVRHESKAERILNVQAFRGDQIASDFRGAFAETHAAIVERDRLMVETVVWVQA